MDSAFFLGREATAAAAAAAATAAAAASSGTVACCDGITREEEKEEEERVYAEEERALLERAERSFDRFCEKVGLAPALRLQARLSWLLDNRGTVRGAVSAAAAALLCPRAEAFLAEDPDLMGRAAAAIADGGRECGAGIRGEGGGCPSGRGWGAFVPLAEEMMGAAMRARGGETRAWGGEEDGIVLVVSAAVLLLCGAGGFDGSDGAGQGIFCSGMIALPKLDLFPAATSSMVKLGCFSFFSTALIVWRCLLVHVFNRRHCGGFLYIEGLLQDATAFKKAGMKLFWLELLYEI